MTLNCYAIDPTHFPIYDIHHMLILQNPFISTLILSLVINLAVFVIAYVKQTDKLTDATYGTTFILITWILYLSLPSPTLLHTIITLLVTLWGLRLITYLFVRIHKMGRDKRFDEMRQQPLKFLQFWLLQGLAVWVILLPTIHILTGVTNPTLNSISILGIIIFATGLTVEAIADWQKFQFKLDPQKKNKWTNTGLWHYARHPNYFGEMLCWWGIFIIATPFLSGLSWLTISSPIFITILLRYVSGIPLLEKRYAQKFANNPEYRQYLSSTNLLLPLPK